MSVFRRPTRAAGYSWRKWEDPIIYRRSRLQLAAFWLFCVDVGMYAALALYLTHHS